MVPEGDKVREAARGKDIERDGLGVVLLFG